QAARYSTLSREHTPIRIPKRASLFDQPALEQLRIVEYNVADPYTNGNEQYRGVLLEDVLTVAGAAEDASTLHMVALDGYSVDVPTDVMRWPVMIAMYQNGETIPTTDKGPLRIVFPYGLYSDIDADVHNPMWVWQLESIEVR
ncbi:MAG: molybdopterin-dependent oxidoreductase, partial [Chloroflexaceae bacterium]|nr:molybdopterin-dependent oxidoreductase [Chloroflexaceae bacterium]